jgi:hypothetical protein
MWRQRIFGWIGVLVMTGLIGYLVASRWPADPKPAVYTAPTFDEPADPGHRRAFHEVCPAINRPEVVALLEQPAEVHGQGTSYGTDPGYLSCHVTLKLASLRVDVGDGLTVASMRRVSPDAHDLTVLGRPAMLETTKGLMFITSLLIAWDQGDSGGYVSVFFLKPDGYADPATMTHLAELVLPHLPGWNTPLGPVARP